MRMPLFLTLALGLVVACSTPTSACGCSPAEPVGIVYGTIAAAAETPLRGAEIRVRKTAGTCPGRGASASVDWEKATSDTTGQYRIVVGGGTDTLCVQLIAYRGATARTDSLISSTRTLPLKVGLPHDSTRVDFRFP
jgi:hypothetical protein